jgi:hypothetical protein
VRFGRKQSIKNAVHVVWIDSGARILHGDQQVARSVKLGLHQQRSFATFDRQRAQALEEQRKPQPTKTVWAVGSMEWLAEQETRAKRMPLGAGN